MVFISTFKYELVQKMECTQRLECTQELYETHTERVCPEQIGFLGICGAKHPILKGPNKIGRDPQTCSIILNLNSVSRQHAVINVLNSKEFMLMDLDSANKTKLLNKVLPPYIPHPMRNGDTVQFGDIFGIFRLLEDDDELPMTQAIDVPETPVPTQRYVSKLTKVHTTIIPESPDVSDRDDSLITTTQTNTSRTRLSSGQFIQSFGKTLPIQPISTPKTETDSNFSKRSSSFNNANTSLNESYKPVTDDKNIDNIHEMNTQLPYPLANPNINESTDSIYTADTQIPPGHGVSPSIHSLDTQIPTAENLPQVRKIDGQHEMQFDIYASNKENDLSIHNAETQPFFSAKDESIGDKSKSIATKEVEVVHKSEIFLNKSNEELLFDEIDDGCLEDFNSQPLLPQESPIRDPTVSSKLDNIESDNSPDQDIDSLSALKFTVLRKNKNSEEIKEKVSTEQDEQKNRSFNISEASKRANRINSDDSTDCEDIDILPTQKVEKLKIKTTTSRADEKVQSLASKKDNRFKSDSSTDCDDFESALTQKIPNFSEATDNSKAKGNVNASVDASRRINMSHLDTSADSEDLALMATQKVLEIKSNEDEDVTDCEDNSIEPNSKGLSKGVKTTKFEDMPTQVLDLDPDHLKPSFEEMDTQIIGIDENAIENSTNNDSFGYQPTQIIDEIIPNNDIIQKPLDTIISPFKIPLQSPIRVKSKDIPKINSFIHPKDPKPKNIPTIDDDNYYNATQDILDDLSTQRDESPMKTKESEKSKARSSSPIIIDDELIPCSVEDYKVGQKFANIDRDLDLSGSWEEHKAKNFAGGLSCQEVRNVISVEPQVEKPKNNDSSSDVDCTPKKKRPFVFSDSDLPDSQEIRNHISTKPNNSYTIESSSESESEVIPEEQFTPIVHRTKKYKTVAKIDLTKRFEAQKLPERIITRVRKPTLKMEESVKSDKKITANILKSKFLTEEEEYINEDILQENIKRLKTYARAKSSKENSNDTKTELNKNQTKCEDIKTELKSKEEKNKNATEKKINKSKEKIKVKIEEPKKKVAKDNKTKSKEDTSREEQESNTINTHKSKEKSPEPNSKIETDRESQNDRTTSEIKSNSTSDDKINTRTTRSRRKGTDRKLAELKSTSPVNNKKATNNRSRRSTRKKEASNDSTTSEVEVRRSRRQVKTKENTSVTQDSETTQAPKSILKKSLHEQSTVYNISSSSGESPKSLKRSLAEEIDVPSPKRTRAFVNSTNSSANNVSLKAVTTKNMKTQHVLFTAFPSDEVKHKLEGLGAVVVTNVMECSIVLTMSIKRTFKLLCAVGLGRPVVGPAWVQACVDTQMIVNPWLYLIKDEAAEKRFQFDLEKTLKGKRNFLKGYNVSSTPNVQPNATEMKLIVECSGGVWKEGGSNWVCVSSSKDQSLWPSLRKRGATVVTTEFILGGVLRQKIEIIANKFP